VTAPGISQNQIAGAEFASAAAAYGLPNDGNYDSFGHLQKVVASILDVNLQGSVINALDPAYGVRADGVTDDAPGLQAAADAALARGLALYIPRGGTYRLASTLNLRFIQLIADDATFSVDHADIGIHLGGNANSQNNPTQFIGMVTRVGGATATPTLRITGAKGQHIVIQRVDYVQVYADTDPAVSSTDSSSAYSSFWIKRCNTLELNNNAATTGSSVQWINENKFWLDRIDNFYCRGTYAHNRNEFFGGSFEGATLGGDLHLEVGQSNIFHGIRHEGSSGTIEFGANTYYNEVAFGYASNQRVGLGDVRSGFTISDLGWRNVVRWVRDPGLQRIPLIAINPFAVRSYTNDSGGTGDYFSNITTLRGVNVQRLGISTIHRANSRPIWRSGIIPVEPGDAIVFEGSAGIFRYFVEVYDANGNQITTEPTNDVIVSAGIPWSGGTTRYAASTNRTFDTFQVRSGAVAFVRVGISSGSNAANVPIEFVGCYLVTNWTRTQLFATQAQLSQGAAASSVPTRGFAYQGEAVRKPTGGWYSCTFALETTLSASAAGGATSVSVTDATGVEDGDIVGILLDDGTTHWTSVTNLSGSTFDVSALPSAAASGRQIVFNRWAEDTDSALLDNSNTRTQLISNVKTNLVSGAATVFFNVTKRLAGTGSQNRSTFAGEIHISVAARTSGGQLRNRTARVTFGLAVSGSGNIALAQGTQETLDVYSSGLHDCRGIAERHQPERAACHHDHADIRDAREQQRGGVHQRRDGLYFTRSAPHAGGGLMRKVATGSSLSTHSLRLT
jgi:hypothetical protein